MAVSAVERRYLLSQLSSLAVRDLYSLLDRAKRLSDAEFAAFVVDAFPQLADPYVEMAAQLAADWFEHSDPAGKYVALTADPISRERLEASARWALQSLGTPEGTFQSRLDGALQRAVFDGSRETTLVNVERTGSRWRRDARPDACAFCKMLATRSDYRSEEDAEMVSGRSIDLTLADRRQRASGLATTEELLARRATYSRGRRRGQTRVRSQRGTQALGEKFHDHCFCVAVEVWPGQEVEVPAYVDDWERIYNKARDQSGSSDPKAILSAWRQIDGSA